MRSIHRSNRRRSSNLVNSPKCAAAIRAATPLHRDLLVQSSLDAHVRSIEFADEICHRGRAASPRSIVLYRDDGRFMLDIEGSGVDRDSEDTCSLVSELRLQGISLLEIKSEEIRREPRFGNARRVWEFRDLDPTMRERDRILYRLDERGPQTVRELEMLATSYDVLPAVCALACADVVEIDIDGTPIGPRTLVRARR
jgi:hypothetical protein